MSNDLNQCQFIGRLGAEPETRYLNSGDAVVSFRIAVGAKFKDREETEWVSITAFGKLAEICSTYLKKGSQVFIQGRMKTDTYEKNGEKRYSTKIIANQMQMLGGRSDNGSAPQQNHQQPRQQAAAKPQQNPSAGFDDFEDDIPF